MTHDFYQGVIFIRYIDNEANVHKGDILRINTWVYYPFVGSRWVDHFVQKPVLCLVIEEPTNNGNTIIKFSNGIELWFNVIVQKNEILEILKKG